MSWCPGEATQSQRLFFAFQALTNSQYPSYPHRYPRVRAVPAMSCHAAPARPKIKFFRRRRFRASPAVPSQTRRPQVDDDVVPPRARPSQAGPCVAVNDGTFKRIHVCAGTNPVLGPQALSHRAPGSPTAARVAVRVSNLPIGNSRIAHFSPGVSL